jgi:hypothetical protein
MGGGQDDHAAAPLSLSKHVKELLKECKEAIEEEPEDCEAYLTLASLYHREGMLDLSFKTLGARACSPATAFF